MDRSGYYVMNFEEMYAAILKMNDEERNKLLQTLLKYEAVEIQMKKEPTELRNRIFFRRDK